ncbi:hypothetical protein [Kitasatospora sp. NPDC093806]|uniref:hypothetical protein n=1 Tax=Kitasatospora sp. NPDC093806 TaxID=3155075 RepID=UPI00343642ED
MHPSQLVVRFTETATGVRTSIHHAGQAAPLTPTTSGPFPDITTPLAARGIPYTATRYIEAELPDEAILFITPRYHREAISGWFVTREGPGREFEELYDSDVGGVNEEHGGAVGPMLAVVDEHLDRIGVPTRQQVQARRAGAESVLHRAGFVAAGRLHETYYRLPAAMVDPEERRTAVAGAVGRLQSAGYGVEDAAGLPVLAVPPTALPSLPLAQVGESIASSTHTQEMVAALSELTAPGDGVMDQVLDALHETASWWEGLGGAADPYYAARLRYLADMADGYVREVRAMRDDLADRHTPHPGPARPAVRGAADRLDARAAAALATSPAAARTPTGHPLEAVRPAAVPAARTAAPHR